MFASTGGVCHCMFCSGWCFYVGIVSFVSGYGILSSLFGGGCTVFMLLYLVGDLVGVIGGVILSLCLVILMCLV